LNGFDTYIIETIFNEFYCGKSRNINKRLKEHQKEKYPHWFNTIKRKQWSKIYLFKGDIEKIIKRAKSKNIIKIVKSFDKSMEYKEVSNP